MGFLATTTGHAALKVQLNATFMNTNNRKNVPKSLFDVGADFVAVATVPSPRGLGIVLTGPDAGLQKYWIDFLRTSITPIAEDLRVNISSALSEGANQEGININFDWEKGLEGDPTYLKIFRGVDPDNNNTPYLALIVVSDPVPQSPNP
ncbi:MAG: hypothetical protein HQ502_04240 [Alphaproteobacteria bacterium]|nr:hypothetical protein [Alphaproteobacteria bacterium]